MEILAIYVTLIPKDTTDVFIQVFLQLLLMHWNPIHVQGYFEMKLLDLLLDFTT